MANEREAMESGQKIKARTNNYFRVGVRCAFFNDWDAAGVQQAWNQAVSWLGTSTDTRVRVWRMPSVLGPWHIVCENGVIAPESLYMGRSQLGPVVS